MSGIKNARCRIPAHMHHANTPAYSLKNLSCVPCPFMGETSGKVSTSFSSPAGYTYSEGGRQSAQDPFQCFRGHSSVSEISTLSPKPQRWPYWWRWLKKSPLWTRVRALRTLIGLNSSERPDLGALPHPVPMGPGDTWKLRTVPQL